MNFLSYHIAVQFYGQDDVFIDVQNRDKVVVLEDKADIAPTEDGKLLVVQLGQLFSLDLNAAGGGHVQTAHHVQQSGLAAAGGSDNGDKFPLLNGEGHAVQRLCDVRLL